MVFVFYFDEMKVEEENLLFWWSIHRCCLRGRLGRAAVLSAESRRTTDVSHHPDGNDGNEANNGRKGHAGRWLPPLSKRCASFV
jgi:hypothetical protein